MPTTIDGTQGVIFPDGSVQGKGSLFAPWQYDWHPYNRTQEGGTETGEVWSFATNGAVALITSPDMEDGWNYRFRIRRVQQGGTGALAIRVNPYRETSAAYAGVSNTGTNVGVGLASSCYVELDRPRVAANEHVIYSYNLLDSGAASPADSTANNGTPSSAMMYTHATAQKLLRAQLSFTSQNFQGALAAVFWERKRSVQG